MFNKALKLISTLCLSLLIGLPNAVSEIPGISKEYGEHLMGIGIVEQSAGTLLINYAEKFITFSLTDDEMDTFNKVVNIMDECFYRHKAIVPPSACVEVHELWEIILQAHSKGFKLLFSAVQEKNRDLVEKAFNELYSVSEEIKKVEAIGNSLLQK